MADKAVDSQVNFTSSRFRDFCATNPIPASHALHDPISRQDLTRLDQSKDDILDDNIPPVEPANDTQEPGPAIMKCCCGSPDCSYLEHNHAALGGLERDLETAARLGQALLDRHEAYVKESQAEQARLSSYIHDLEHEKTSLQDANHKIVVENKELLQKLEQLNTDFGESGKRVHELEDLLQDYEQEIRRLNGLTRKTQELELKVLDMEREHSDLIQERDEGRKETRSTIVRWKESEKKVRQLEQEVQRIEHAARADREKHEDLVARMEKDRALERELGLSEGRLKATAAVQTMQSGGTQKQVVSNFVRDILQDNANLQAGIAELRELLQSSNDEVQSLREQVMLHQPVQDDESEPHQRTLSLSDELAMSQSLPPKQVQQELHVHHHYHTKLGSKKEKTPIRKTPRRRALMPSAALSSSPATSGISTPVVRPQRYASSPTVPMSLKTAHSANNRWSMQSNTTTSTYLSSMASSPRSYYDRTSSIFDRIERDEESSRPTSPDSFDISSPIPFKRQDRQDDAALSVFEEEAPDLHEDQSSWNSALQHPLPELQVTENNHVHHDQLDEEGGTSQCMELTPKPSMKLNYEGQNIQELSQSSGQEEGKVSISPRPSPSKSLSSPKTLGKNAQSDRAQELPRKQLFQPQPQSPTKKLSEIEIRPSIRRSNSHDSLLSISGMDIHLTQQSSRSTLALLRGHGANKHHFSPIPNSIRQTQASTSQPLATVTEYTATSRPGLEPANSASMIALSGIHSSTVRGNELQPQNKGLIGSVGGWVSSKWGRSPTHMKSVVDLRSPASTVLKNATKPSSSADPFIQTPGTLSPSSASIAPSTTSNSTISSGKRSVLANAIDMKGTSNRTALTVSSSLLSTSVLNRPTGINQSGPIFGFAEAVAAKRTPTTINPPKVDISGLEESLAER